MLNLHRFNFVGYQGMVHRSYFDIDEKEATKEELRNVALTAISILGIVVM